MKLILEDTDIAQVKKLLESECSVFLTDEQLQAFLDADKSFVRHWYLYGKIDRELETCIFNALVGWVMKDHKKSQHNTWFKKGLVQPWTWPDENSTAEYQAEFKAEFAKVAATKNIKIK
jgi:hypothetical protein